MRKRNSSPGGSPRIPDVAQVRGSIRSSDSAEQDDCSSIEVETEGRGLPELKGSSPRRRGSAIMAQAIEARVMMDNLQGSSKGPHKSGKSPRSSSKSPRNSRQE